MRTPVREHRRTHRPAGAQEPVLPALAPAAASEPMDPALVATLARDLGLPIAAVRGAVSSFDAPPPGATLVCRGTSCALAAAGGEGTGAAAGAACHPVHCLGRCDRSPVALAPDGRFLGPAFAAGDGATDVRCAARHPVTTRRLRGEGVSATIDAAFAGLRAALRLPPSAVIDSIEAAGLRGRGGAAYPTGRKWRAAAEASGTRRFIVANGDEGDPGSFIDRELMERDPGAILDGMAIAAHAVGADRGIVFVRGEYPRAAAVLEAAISEARRAGLLGPDALGPGRGFDVEVVRGLGSYVCGEETALLSAIEGMRGEVRPRPPYPTESGLFGCPTVVDNVETLVDASWILERGAEGYAAMGTPASRGTKAICLNRGFARPGIVEVEFGIALREVIEQLGGGGAGGTPLEAVLLGGPMGSVVPASAWDVPVCFDEMARRGIVLGHAGMVALPRGTDWRALVRHLLEFMRHESCGKCVPCRLGSDRALRQAREGLDGAAQAELARIFDLMESASLCAFGRGTPGPIRDILRQFLGGAA